MTNQAEIQPIINVTGGNSAPKHGSHGDAAPLIHNMVDDYVTITEVLKTINPDEEPDRYEQVSSYLDTREAYIQEMVVEAIDGDALELDSRLLKKADEDHEVYAELYTEREVKKVRGQRIKAMASRVMKQVMTGRIFTQNPGHISLEPEASPDSPSTIAYVDVVKGSLKASAKAIRKIREAAVIRSEEITLPARPGHFIDEELLEDPRHSDEITQAFNLRTIKPEDLRVK